MTIDIHLIRTYYPHWGIYSGINQFLQYLDKDSYRVKVQLVPDNNEDFPIQNKFMQNWILNFAQRRGMKWYKLSDLIAEIKAFKYSCFGKIDIIHYLDGEHSAQFLPGLSKPFHKIRPKIVATYHQPPELLDSLIIRDIIYKLDCITVVSPEQVAYFQEFVAPDKVHLILHGINTDYFKPRDLPKEDGKFRCITAGFYLRDFKAIRAVAERLKDYQEIEFHVVSSQLTGLEVLTNVTIYKGIDDVKLLELYQQSNVLFLPLLQSTANNAILEGIACGLPVISTDLPSVRAYLPGNEALLIKDNDPKQLADIILHLLHNPKDRKNMSQEARKRAKELDWQRIAPQYEAIYSNLINSN